MRHLSSVKLKQHLDEGLTPEQIAKKYTGHEDPNVIYYMIRMYGIIPEVQTKKRKMAVGLDVGTSRLLSARNEASKIVLKAQRDAFLRLPGDAQTTRALKRLKVNYIKLEDGFYVVGDDAFQYAQVFPSTVLRRPMSSGMLNPAEPDAFPVLQALILDLLGEPRTKNETCVYSIPAAPVDEDKLTEYHSDIVGEIVESLGYKATAFNEGIAIGTIGLKPDYTGLTISFGGGLANAAIMYKGLSALQLSVTQAGDFIDENAARDTGTAKVHITALKENGTIDISADQNTREGQAIKSYYILAIRHMLTHLADQFNRSSNMPHFDVPIKVACAGGGVLIKGYDKLFRQEFKAMDMPFDILDDGIQVVPDPLSAVARGCLSEALLDE
jgi:hypothetical protein